MLETSRYGSVLYDLYLKELKPCIINAFNCSQMCDIVRILKSTPDLLQTQAVCKCLKMCLKIIQFVKSFHPAVAPITQVYLMLKVISNCVKIY